MCSVHPALHNWWLPSVFSSRRATSVTSPAVQGLPEARKIATQKLKWTRRTCSAVPTLMQSITILQQSERAEAVSCSVAPWHVHIQIQSPSRVSCTSSLMFRMLGTLHCSYNSDAVQATVAEAQLQTTKHSNTCSWICLEPTRCTGICSKPVQILAGCNDECNDSELGAHSPDRGRLAISSTAAGRQRPWPACRAGAAAWLLNSGRPQGGCLAAAAAWPGLAPRTWSAHGTQTGSPCWCGPVDLRLFSTVLRVRVSCNLDLQVLPGQNSRAS